MAFPTHTTGNLFLDSLPSKPSNLESALVKVSLKLGDIVYDSDERIDKVLFPIASIVSIVLVMSDGETAEVGIVGREGTTGLPIALGQSSSNHRAIVQVPDSAYCCTRSDFVTALERHPEFKAYCLRFAQAMFMSSAQLSACNNLHSTNERCARWLLMAHDRVDSDTISLTQEFLSQMLGVRRTGVTLAASALQEAGFISYSRGHIVIRNRAGLESATCECYEVLERYWGKLMPYSVRKSELSHAAGMTDSPAG